MRPLEDLLDWCLEALKEERDRAREAVEGRDPRAVAFRLAQAEDESRAMHRFAAELPGVRRAIGVEVLEPEAASLAFRVLRAALITGACLPFGEEPRRDLADRLLLVLGLVLDPSAFRELLEGDGEPRDPASLVEGLGGRAVLARHLEGLLEDRTRPLLRLPEASAFRGSFAYLTVAAGTEAALALFRERTIRPEALEALELALNTRGVAVVRLLVMASRADGVVDSEEDRAVAVMQECLGIRDEAWGGADPTAEEVRRLFPTEEERAGLVSGIATVIAADGLVDRREELMCRVVATALGLPRERVEGLLERARRSAADR